MAFPTGVKFLLAGASIQDSQVVARSEMDRGPAKTRREATDPIVTVAGTLQFATAAAYQAWRTWFYSRTGANAGAGWFDWTDPRDGTVRRARFVSTAMGELQPVVGRFVVARQACSLEYIDQLP